MRYQPWGVGDVDFVSAAMMPTKRAAEAGVIRDDLGMAYAIQRDVDVLEPFICIDQGMRHAAE